MIELRSVATVRRRPNVDDLVDTVAHQQADECLRRDGWSVRR